MLTSGRNRQWAAVRTYLLLVKSFKNYLNLNKLDLSHLLTMLPPHSGCPLTLRRTYGNVEL